MRNTIAAALIIAALLFACVRVSSSQQPKADKYAIPRAELDFILNNYRDIKIAKLETEQKSIERTIKDKRGKELTAARTKLKELQAEIARIKAAKKHIPEIDIEGKEPFGVGYLVEFYENDKGERVSRPAVVTVTANETEGTIAAKTKSGRELFILTESRRQISDSLTLDMPVKATPAGDGRGSFINVQLFEL